VPFTAASQTRRRQQFCPMKSVGDIYRRCLQTVQHPQLPNEARGPTVSSHRRSRNPRAGLPASEPQPHQGRPSPACGPAAERNRWRVWHRCCLSGNALEVPRVSSATADDEQAPLERSDPHRKSRKIPVNALVIDCTQTDTLGGLVKICGSCGEPGEASGCNDSEACEKSRGAAGRISSAPKRNSLPQVRRGQRFLPRGARRTSQASGC
jgi:hypothetical protein